MNLRLLVIRCADIEKSKRFYEVLGMNFIRESHNGSSIHYSTKIGGLVFEIYPSSARYPICKTRLGFNSTIAKEVIKMIARDSYTYNNQEVYILADPDGRKVELY
jgi:lactoylglutathione lyase